MKITLELNPDLTKEQAEMVAELAKILVGKGLMGKTEEPKDDKPEEKPKRKTKAKAKETPVIPTKEPEPQPEKAEPTVDLAKVRETLGGVIKDKGKEARDKAAEKLQEYGAKNVSTLKAEHYADFVEFLESL